MPNPKHQNAQIEEFSILVTKNLKSKNCLTKVLRNDLIFQIASSSDHMSITNLRNARLNNFELRNFLREFNEKCFAVFGQSNCVIYLVWYRSLLLFQEFSSIILFIYGMALRF